MKKLFSSDFDSSISKLTLSIGNELSIVNFSSNLIKLSQEQENKLFKAFRGTYTSLCFRRNFEICHKFQSCLSKNCEKCFKSYLGIIFNVCRCK